MKERSVARPIERADHDGWRPYRTTQTGNPAGRALPDKLAAYPGFIVYSDEL